MWFSVCTIHILVNKVVNYGEIKILIVFTPDKTIATILEPYHNINMHIILIYFCNSETDTSELLEHILKKYFLCIT